MTGATFDAGALVAVDKGDPKFTALFRQMRRQEVPIYIPAGVLGQAWRGVAQQHDLHTLLRSRLVTVEPLDEAMAREIGKLLGEHRARDVVDASVAITALKHDTVICTSDPLDIGRLLGPGEAHRLVPLT